MFRDRTLTDSSASNHLPPLLTPLDPWTRGRCSVHTRVLSDVDPSVLLTLVKETKERVCLSVCDQSPPSRGSLSCLVSHPNSRLALSPHAVAA
jgi:hypothetical protein